VAARDRDKGVAAQGAASVAIGGNAEGPISISYTYINSLQVLDAPLIPVAVAAQDPVSLPASGTAEAFTGRKWLAAELDRFLAANSSGYVWVEGDAGVGKTWFAAWLARERGYVSHFSQHSGGTHPGVALRNLSAQLIRDFSLGAQAPGGLVPAWASTPEGFQGLLRLAVAEARRLGQLLVLVVDGFDEADAAPGHLPFELPVTLPDGAFLVGTYRTGWVPPLPRAPAVTLHIDKDDPRNRTDIAEFLSRAAATDWLSARLTATDMAAREFVELLTRRCDGVLVYLRYVLTELRVGARGPAEIAELPVGLDEYYAYQIRRWRSDSAWEAALLPMLATLSAAGEPLSATTLARLAGGIGLPAVRGWCDLTVRALLAAQTGPGPASPVRYEIYHASFREVLQGALAGSGGQRPYNLVALAGELRDASLTAHARIADTYLGQFGDLADGLPHLAADPGLAARTDDGYPLRHLTRHLQAAHREADLHKLLAAEIPPGHVPAGNVWFTAHDHAGSAATYLEDLALARRDTMKTTDRALASGQIAGSFAQEIRYFMMAAAVASRAGNVPVSLLSQLVSTGLWSPEHALDHTRRLASADERLKALDTLRPLVPAGLRDVLNADALAAAAGVRDGERGQALAALAPYLSGSLMAGALDAARAILEEASRAQALTGLAPHVGEDQCRAVLTEALAAATAIRRGSTALISRVTQRAGALAALAPYLSGSLMTEALDAARAIGDEDSRAQALTGLAPHVGQDQCRAVLTEALAAATAISRSTRSLARDGTPERAERLAALAPYLPEDLLEQALTAAIGISHEDSRADALVGLVPHLPEDMISRVLKAIPDLGRYQDRAIEKLAPLLPEHFRARVVTIAESAADDFTRGRCLVALAPYLSADLLAQAVALTADRPSHEDYRVSALVKLAPYLPDDLHAQAMKAADTISTDYKRVKAQIALAVHAPAKSQAAELSQALAALWAHVTYGWLDPLAELAPRLAPDVALQSVLSSTLSSDEKRSQALVVLAPYLAGASLTEALSAAAAIGIVRFRVEALTALALQASANQRRDALTMALAASSSTHIAVYKAEFLSRLAPHAPESDQYADFAGALDATAVSSDSRNAGTLPRLAPYLPPDLLARAVDAAAAISDGHYRSTALTGLAPYLPPDLLARAVDAAADISDGSYLSRSTALTGLAPYLPPDLLGRAVDAAANIDRQLESLTALCGLVPYLPAAKQLPVLTEISTLSKTAISSVVTDRFHWMVFTAMAPHLHGDALTEAVASAAALSEPDWRARSLMVLAEHLPPEQRFAALAQALRGIRYGDFEVMSELAPLLPPELLAEAVEWAIDLRFAPARPDALKSLVPYLPPELLARAVKAVLAMPDREAAKYLSSLAPHLPADLIGQATTRALGFTSSSTTRASVLVSLVPYLPAEKQAAIIAPALEAASESRTEAGAKSLIALLPYLSAGERAGVVAQALDDADYMAAGGYGGTSLVKLVPYLPANMLTRAVIAAAAISQETDRAKTLAGLAPYLPVDLVPQAMSANPDTRARILAAAVNDHSVTSAPDRSLISKAELIRIGLTGARCAESLRIIEESLQAITLIGGAATIQECIEAMDGICRWWP
jgi:alkylhydroperoxidase/carboxymuconolactone decarboxylase family protein YurZ